MKSRMRSIILFVVGLTLTAMQAMAATYTVYGQHNVTPLYFDINTVTVSDGIFNGTPTWDVIMTVAGSLNNAGNINNQYNVNFATDPNSVFSNYGHGLTPPTPDQTLAVSFNYDPNNITHFLFGTDGNLNLVNASASNNTITWHVDKNSLSTPFWFGGQTVNLSTTVIDHTNISSSNTPIPGAAWLLGSGVLGLFGLKRKKDQLAV